jgi:glucokinase
VTAGDDGCWLGFDIGASKLLACAIDGEGRTLAVQKAATGRDDGPDAVLARVLALGRALRGSAALDGRRLRGVGAGFAGLVDRERGLVRSSIMLPGWDGVPLALRLQKALHAPASIDNDATLAGLGEYRHLGSPPGLNMVLLTVGTGIGGALILGGRLYRGSRGLAGEIGNTTVDRHGPACWCGSRGCLNTLASGSAIAARAGRADGEATAAAAAGGDAAARAAIDDGARALGAGIANLINLFDPDRVVIAGGIAGLGDAWFDLVRTEARARAFAEIAEHVRIEPSARGYDVGAYGAALYGQSAATADGRT